jgi:hypothetical protein
MKKILLLAVLAAAGGYWLLLSKPALYYGSSLDYKCFTLHSAGAVPEGTEAVLDRALAHITGSEFYTPEARFEVYLTGGPRELGFFAPFVRGEYSRVSPVSGGIFLADSDFAADKSRPAPDSEEHRMLSRVLAAAAARELVRHKVEPLTYLFMSDWQVAGYGENISGGTGQFVPADICGKDAPEGSALKDYEYGLAVGLILSDEKMSFSDLLNKNYSYDWAEKQLKQRHCRK